MRIVIVIVDSCIARVIVKGREVASMEYIADSMEVALDEIFVKACHLMERYGNVDSIKMVNVETSPKVAKATIEVVYRFNR